MAKVNGALLSFNAGGQVAQTLVFSRWKGRPYTRRYVIPSNPQSSGQTMTRSVFSWLNGIWKTAPANLTNTWNAYAKGKVLIGRNAFLGQNVVALRSGSDLTGMIVSPGAAGGLSVTPSITGGAGTITIDMVAPDPLPAGWTIIKAVAVAILNQDPHVDTSYTVEAGEDSSSTYSITLSGLDPGEYAVGGWFVYQRSSLTTDLAYGASLVQLVTVT